MTVKLDLSAEQLMALAKQLPPNQQAELIKQVITTSSPLPKEAILEQLEKLPPSLRKELAREMTLQNLSSFNEFLALTKKLPQDLINRLTYQLRKEEGIDGLIKLSEKIQREVEPQYLPTEDEINNMVSEAREELYERRKEKS